MHYDKLIPQVLLPLALPVFSSTAFECQTFHQKLLLMDSQFFLILIIFLCTPLHGFVV